MGSFQGAPSKRKENEYKKEGDEDIWHKECTNIIGACQNFISSVLLGGDMRLAGRPHDIFLFEELLHKSRFVKFEQ